MIRTAITPIPFRELLRKHLLLLVCLGLFVSFATGQNSSAPGSPNASDTKASLAATLKLIQVQVNKQGQIRYTMTSKSTASGETVQDKYLVETSNAVGDANSCSLQVDARMALNGVTQAQGRPVVTLRNIDAITVKSQSQAIEEKTKQAGVKKWTGTISPGNYMVQAFQSGGLAGMFFFRDQEAASLVAKDISRAVELCGGRKSTFHPK
jgi:hypothetical protein